MGAVLVALLVLNDSRVFIFEDGDFKSRLDVGLRVLASALLLLPGCCSFRLFVLDLLTHSDFEFLVNVFYYSLTEAIF